MKTTNSIHPVVVALLFGYLGFARIPGNLYSQQWQFVTGEYLGTAFNGAGTVLVVGEHGLIMRSSDNGVAWELPASNTYKTLRDVAFVNRDEALAVGDSGLLLRSEDGGATWEAVIVPDADGELDNLAVRGNSVWMTSGDRLLRSTDGGGTWGTAVPLPDTALSLAMATEGIGLMVSGDGTIYRTTDSGLTWNPGFQQLEARFQAVAFSPNGHIGVAGGAKSNVYITRDSGNTWAFSDMRDTLLNIFTAAVNDGGSITVGGGLHLGEDSILFVSRDTGGTWEIVRFFHATNHASVLSVKLGEDDTGIASTDFGAIFMTGNVWRTIDTTTNIKNVEVSRLPNSLRNGAIAANNTGIILGNSQGGGFSATTDGGITWKYRLGGSVAWRSIERAGSDHLLMFGERVRQIYRTDDAGKTTEWLGELIPNELTTFAHSQVLDARSVFYLHNANDKSSGILRYSADSGRTFEKVVFSDVRQYGPLDFITPDIGVIGGFTLPDDQDSIAEGYAYGALFLTKDGGRNRKLIYDYSGIGNATGWTAEMVDTNTILLATGGGTFGLPSKHLILKTSDQGENWEIGYTSDWRFYDLAAFNDSIWYAVGENAMIVMTSDRGKTWTEEKIEPLPRFPPFGQVPRFRQIFLLPDDRTAMIIGEGTILRKVFPQKLSGVAGGGKGDEESGTLQIYPNPIRDEALIGWEGSGEITELILFDVLGREILNYKRGVRSGEKIRMDLSGLVPGTYRLVGRGADRSTITTASFVVE